MRTIMISFIMLLALLCIVPLNAQEKMNKNAVAAELLGDATRTGDKWVQLLEAMPEDKLDWRPQEGVRSVRELFTHIADANFFFLTFIGMEMPQDPDMPKDQKARENRFTSKEAILSHLSGSYEATKTHVSALDAKRLNAEVKMFGNTVSGRAAMMTNLGHMHEHLGQAIAYARVLGITPPWSAGN